MRTLLRDVRFALRALRRDRLVAITAILSLGVAIGGNAAVFSLVDGFLLRPLPFEEPDRMVVVGERQEDQPALSGFLATSLPTFEDAAERSVTVGSWTAMRPLTMSLRGEDGSEPLTATAVRPGFFRLFGATPSMGRTFTDDEGVEGARKVAILGYEYWIDRYGESASPLGDVLTLNGEPHEVVGVSRPNFGFLAPNQQVWVPLTASRDEADRGDRNVIAIGRLGPDVSMEHARGEMSVIAQQLRDEFPETQRNWTFDVYNVRYDIPTRQTRLLFMLLQGSVVAVLLIACVNITNLLMARGQERRQEIALRTILGAGRGRVVRQLLTESSILVLSGAVLALGIAFVGIRTISNQFAGVLPPGFEVVMDGRVLLFTLAVSVVAGLIFGVAPALQTFKKGQADALRDGDTRGGRGRRRKLLSRTLVVAEIALSYVALGGGSLLVQSFLELQTSDPGFEAGNVLTASVTVPRSKYPSPEAKVQWRDRALAEVMALPGVESAAFTTALPQNPFAATDSFRVAGAVVDLVAPPPESVVLQVTPQYLRTLGVAITAGRFLETRDREDGDRVAVINRTLADTHFGPEGPIGRQIAVRGESRTVVGVADDIQQGLFQNPLTQTGETIYLPVAQGPDGANSLMVRTTTEPRSVSDAVRETLRRQDPDLSVSQILTMDEFVEQFFVGVQVFNVVLGGFGIVALLLAALGTYGVLAYSVNQRRREIGIRMTVGAGPRQVVAMVAREGVWLGVIGLGLGVLLTVPLIGVMRTILLGAATIEPQVLVLIGALLFAVTVAASLVPSSRAAMVDPVSTMKDG